MNRESEQKNIGIIIQGPVITHGQGPNYSNEGFNALDTILANIEHIKKYNFKYVISTWEPQNDLEKTIVGSLEKKEPCVLTLKVPELFETDNRYKHHYGILKGIEYLENQYDIDFFVKIRTDMLMPEEFYRFVINESILNKDFLYVSELMDIPFYIGDFIYAGKSQGFKGFIEHIVNNPQNIQPATTMDTGTKFFQSKSAFKIEREKNQWINLWYFYIFRRKFLQKLWYEFVQENIEVCPKDIWHKIIWRDKSMQDAINSKNFKYNKSEIEKEKIPLSDALKFMIFSYKRYTSKRNKKNIYSFLNFLDKIVHLNFKAFLRHPKKEFNKLIVKGQ